MVTVLAVALLVPMAQACPVDPDAGQYGKYQCRSPGVLLPSGEEEVQLFFNLSKKEAEAGLASGEYASCDKVLPTREV